MVKLRKEYIRIDWNLLLPCILLGISPALMQITENMVAISFNTVLQRYGGDMAVVSSNKYIKFSYAVRYAFAAGTGAGGSANIKL